jgi:hypothetical protein
MGGSQTNPTPEALRLVMAVSPERAARLLGVRQSSARTPKAGNAVPHLIDALAMDRLAVAVFGTDPATWKLGISIVVARACRRWTPPQ